MKKRNYFDLPGAIKLLCLLLSISFLTACGDDDDEDPKSDAKEILSFVFADLTPAVTGNVTVTNIAATVPFGTDLTSLSPTVTVSQSATVSPASGAAQDFTSPVTYTVMAEDGSTADYTVTVSVEAGSDAKDITSFVFEGLDPDVTGVITGTEIAADVPFGTDVTTLVPTIVISDLASVDPATGAAQDFTNAVNYTVTAQDGSDQVYTVTVTILPKPGLDITAVWEQNNRTASIPSWFVANNDPDIAVGNGSVYAVNNRDKLRILDPATGNEKVADQVIGQTATGLSGIYANFSGVKVDDGGNIIVCTGTLPGGNWYVFKWDDESATQETILTFATTYRIDNFAVAGDMDGAGYIYAASNGSNEIYKWEVASGEVVNTTPTTITVAAVENFGSFTAIHPMSADANSDILVNGNSIQPILVGIDGTVKDELPEAITTQTLVGFSTDMVYFELGANKVLVTINTPNSNTQDLVFIDVTDGLSSVVADDVQRIEFDDNSAASANANATGGLAFEAGESSVTVYGIITNNGIGAYTVSLSE
ncbi:MAG: DUF5018 domain-containing protein [Cyclobacteriaceae bacterium]|nr:DUF5018 domain-containing protein [Cyclobacteriaceae bacterium HetDA_MAG_MS6]